MANVLVYETVEGWIATNWPDQTSQVMAVSREAAQDKYRLEISPHATEEIRFFGPILTTAYITHDLQADTWSITATADRPYTVAGLSTMENAKTAFMAMWNAEYVANNGGDQVADVNVDWWME